MASSRVNLAFTCTDFYETWYGIMPVEVTVTSYITLIYLFFTSMSDT